MAADLLPNQPPIEAGPVVIDDYYAADPEMMETHIHYPTFVIEALSQSFYQLKATRALEYSVQALIAHLKLGILPPFESVDLDEDDVDMQWGPYSPHDYYIERKTFVTEADMIMAFAAEQTKDPEILEVLRLVRDYSVEQLSYVLDDTPIEELPDAVYTEVYPEGHIAAGQLIPYRDFLNSARAVGTSAGKAASTLDEVVARLGDEQAKEKLAELEWRGNPRDRNFLRISFFVKTQSLADLVQELSVIPAKERDGFNATALRLLRNVLYDEAPEDFGDPATTDELSYL